jgi:hypothetical protein
MSFTLLITGIRLGGAATFASPTTCAGDALTGEVWWTPLEKVFVGEEGGAG